MLTLPSLISLQFVTLEENEGLWFIKEIYEHMSQFNFKHEEQYFIDGLINKDEIPGLHKDYKVDFF